jgi:glycosyltransferase involved in cell wall biosynthesis
MNLWDEISRFSYVTSLLASEKKFDIIHAHDWLTFPAGVIAKETSNKPLIVHVHATEFDRSGENINKDVYNVEKQGMQAADKVITVSNYTKNIVISRYGIHPSKVETIHNAVDNTSNINSKRIIRPINEKIVSFLGRITFQKGPDYFIEAASKVLRKVKNARFVIAGSGDMRDRLVKEVAKLKISTKVNFAGFLRGDEVNKLLRMTDVYVMPSVSEPFGIAPLEAMQCDVPVIISKQSGVSEVLKYALKVDFWDTDCLADAIHSLLEYKVLSKMLRVNGRNEVNKLQWEDVGKKIANIYSSLI